VTRVDAMTSVYWARRNDSSLVVEREGWSDRGVLWSPNGNYLATFHPQGIKVCVAVAVFLKSHALLIAAHPRFHFVVKQPEWCCPPTCASCMLWCVLTLTPLATHTACLRNNLAAARRTEVVYVAAFRSRRSDRD
jgi:hypothetical protein